MIIILWKRTTKSTAKNYVSYVFLVIPSSTSSTRDSGATLSTGQIYGFTEQRKANPGCGAGEIYLALIHSSCCCCSPEDRQQTWTCYFRLFVGNRVSGISQINFEIFQRVPRGFGSLSVAGSGFPGRQRL